MAELHVKVCGGHTRPVCHIDYSGVCDGSYWFLSSSHDSKPMLRNGETGDWVGTFVGHTGAVYGGCIYEGAEKALTVSGDYSAKIWNCLDGGCLNTWTHPHYVKSCDWKDDRVLTGCFDKMVRLFDSTNYDTEPIQWMPHENVCKSVYFLSHGGVLTVCEDEIAQWDLRDLEKPVRQITVDSLNCVDYVRQHQNLIVAAHKNGVSLIDCDTFDARQPITLEDVECASISPDGQNISLGSRLLVKEYSVDGVIQRSHYAHHGPVLHIRYCPTGETYTSGAEDGMIRIWPTSKVLASHENEE
uniref:Serine-threonine kinase receptor-associated protein n=1 Tax=Paramoeba aestuarina TaxID=180227 RepID=A0A7S4UYP8_9EUKA|mmetsp:Transcript_7590/g.11429  ORF Transcript_7590/g.11429 Transcript_7590/m.11429 type:complete len:300 (+) Transcript_7590:21-920(+)